MTPEPSPGAEVIEQIFEAAKSKGPNKSASVRQLAQRYSLNLASLRNSKNQTLLHIAAGYGRANLAKYLINEGAKVDALDDEGQAPLHNACCHGHLHVSQVLIKEGADVNIKDNRGWSPMHFAVSRKDNSEGITPIYRSVIDLLLKSDADPYLESNSGRNCLRKLNNEDDIRYIRLEHILIRIMRLDDVSEIHRIVNKYILIEDFFSLLHTSEVDLDRFRLLVTPETVKFRLADHHNVTPLHMAAGHNHLEAAELLIQCGADVQAVDRRGRIPLHNAAQYGHVKMIELLVDSGSDIDKQDEDGHSPLHVAAQCNSTFLACHRLIGLNANKHLKSKIGNLPYDLAKARSAGDIENLLRPIHEQQTVSGQAIYIDFKDEGADQLEQQELIVMPQERDLMLDSNLDTLPENTKHDIKIIRLEPSDPKYERVKRRMLDTIQVHTSDSGGNFSTYEIVGIDHIMNKNVWRRYRLFCQKLELSTGPARKNERLLFHGSNFIDDIEKNGFDERFAHRNGMFGAGVYFADHSSKSNQYTFGWGQGCKEHMDKSCYICERKMIYAQVALGKSLVSKEAMPECAHAPPGYHSVTGSPESTDNLVYPEYVIYNGDQAYPLFVIRYRIKP